MQDNKYNIEFSIDENNNLSIEKYKNFRYVLTNEEWYSNYDVDKFKLSIFTDWEYVYIQAEGTSDYSMINCFEQEQLFDAIKMYITIKDYTTKEQLVDLGFKEV